MNEKQELLLRLLKAYYYNKDLRTVDTKELLNVTLSIVNSFEELKEMLLHDVSDVIYNLKYKTVE